MRLLSATLDRARADLHLVIETDAGDQLHVTYGDQPRQPGETAAAYRSRLQKLVTGALTEARRSADAIASQAPGTALLAEPADLTTATLANVP